MGNIHSTSKINVRIIRSSKSWIEGEAVHQLETVAKRDGVALAVGMPDLHPGKGLPIGAAFVCEDLIYPSFIGNDIGCAMSFWRTDISVRKLKLDRFAKKLMGLEAPWDGDAFYTPDDWRIKHNLREGLHNSALGTIGGGNHFAELQQVERVEDEAAFAAHGLDRSYCTLLVHSGSRTLGQVIFQRLIDERQAAPFQQDTPEAAQYMKDHEEAMRWSEASRALIAYRFMSQLGGACNLVSDVPHNMISYESWSGKSVWIHRKGAASARVDAVMIPGSRGSLSYLVKPVGEQDDTAWSLAHGAGRRWRRGYAKSRMSHKYRLQDLERNSFGGRVICEDREAMYDEAPQAYKDIEQVIEDMAQAGLIKVIAAYRPLLTYKHRRAG